MVLGAVEVVGTLLRRIESMAEGEVGAHNCPDTKTGRRVRMQCLRMVYTGVTRSGIFVGTDGKKNAVPIRVTRCRMLRPPTLGLGGTGTPARQSAASDRSRAREIFGILSPKS